ncbi:type II toxin-antitoxin system VapC family toxin [Dermabacter vaginalis]|uniref:Ribonuclease VapC n=1 Tax=Dermabacter vaginalis TaxID=1630135 RepID=A0ABX6A1Q9_9MICO|nr:type II toxin-antitoxin system VapC family toxin [Dermabacter vaginalis]MCG7443265.1 type II toxin-antitoxin system VapC family toxin [Dermabacter vaginalis]QEU11098.1 type II toxin-antitoxin system VapC family toxin [Dermabacter vaginalis]
MTNYLDTSVAVAVLEGNVSARAWFKEAVGGRGVVSSRLLQTELTRVLRRQGRPVQERELLLRYVDVAPITDAVLSIAEALPQNVRSLDAIHLATALQLGSAVTVVSHDKQMLAVAQDLGLTVCDPLSA